MPTDDRRYEATVMPETGGRAAGRIFISYRREETAYAAGWLFDRLADHFGNGQIFKDVHSIELGDDFAEAIKAAVGSCDVLLALIGERWLNVTDRDGRPRIHNPADFVRLEIEAALSRGVRVIPILVDGATMPDVDQLPDSLARLARRQALELSPSRFDFDTGRLLRTLEAKLAEVRTLDPGSTSRSEGSQHGGAAVGGMPPSPSGPPPEVSSPAHVTRGRLLAAAAVAVAILVGAAVVVTATSDRGTDTDGRECGHEKIGRCEDLPEAAKHAPALASSHGRLLLAFVENKAASGLRVLVSDQGVDPPASYQVLTRNLPDFSAETPAIIARDGTAYLAWVGTDEAHTLNVMTADLTSSRPFVDRKTVLPGRTSDAGPALAWHRDRLVLAWKGADGRVWLMSSSDGSRFDDAAALPDISTKAAPALASHDGRLFLAWVDSAGVVNVGPLDGLDKVASRATLELQDVEGIAMASAGDDLALAWVTDYNTLGLAASADGSSFSEHLTVPSATNAVPAVALSGDELAMAWTSNDSGRKLRVAFVR